MHTTRWAASSSHVMGLRTVSAKVFGSPRLSIYPVNLHWFSQNCVPFNHARSLPNSASLLDRSPLGLPRHSFAHVAQRRLFWSQKSTLQAQEHFNGPSDGQEEAAKVAILEKVMKGRQPTDLMLRCEHNRSLDLCLGVGV